MEGPEELTLRLAEQGMQKAHIDPYKIAFEAFGSPLVDEDWKSYLRQKKRHRKAEVGT